MTMTELCGELRNYFIIDPGQDIFPGTYEISNGSIITPTPFLTENDYFRIVGSRKNDGVYQYSPMDLSTLVDETFDGNIWVMSVPAGVVTLLDDITAWETATADVRNSPYQSESFGGYTYSLKSFGGSSGSAGGLTWQGAFADRLKPYRKQVVLI